MGGVAAITMVGGAEDRINELVSPPAFPLSFRWLAYLYLTEGVLVRRKVVVDACTGGRGTLDSCEIIHVVGRDLKIMMVLKRKTFLLGFLSCLLLKRMTFFPFVRRRVGRRAENVSKEYIIIHGFNSSILGCTREVAELFHREGYCGAVQLFRASSAS